MNLRNNRRGRCGLWSLLPVLLLTPLVAQDDVISCDPREQTAYRDSIDPEQELPLNCDRMNLVDVGLACIVQNDASADPDRSAELRSLAKILARRAVLRSNGLINGYYTAGVLAGVEVDVFMPSTGTPSPPERLPVRGVLEGVDENGLPVVLGFVYCYNANQLAAREAMLAQELGHPLRVFTAWMSDVMTTSAGWISVTGWNNGFWGELTSNGGISAFGFASEFHDGVTYAETLALHPALLLSWSQQMVTPPSLPEPELEDESARLQAQVEGTYFADDVEITAESQLPPEGLIFSEGDIEVRTSLQGSYTFVSATGSVRFWGSHLSLKPYIGRTVAIAYERGIQVIGYRSSFLGEMWCGNGFLGLFSSETTLLGQFVCDAAWVSGFENVVSDGTHPYLP